MKNKKSSPQETMSEIEKLRASGIVKLKGKDLFSIWIKTSCANLSSKQLMVVAEIARKYGRDFILFSSRQTPIIPFVKLKDIEKVKKILKEVELQLDRCGPTVRNINVCYDKKICPLAKTNSLRLAEKLDNFFYLPMFHKIKIGVVGCEKNCIIGRALNDLCFVGRTEKNESKYDVYFGGRLGVNPFIGIKIGEKLSEDECVKLTQNYFELFKKEGRKGERSADLLKQLGRKKLKEKLMKDLKTKPIFQPISCDTELKEEQKEKVILKIRAVCGEINSLQAKKIAEIAEKKGNSFVHFTVRGSPEIPFIDKRDVSKIEEELKKVGLYLIKMGEGIDNIQCCFGYYCTESYINIQSLLKRIDGFSRKIGLSNDEIKISGSGCPNSCGLPPLNDIGFYGVVEPEINREICSGCSLCAIVCKRKAIKIKNKKAVISKRKCKHCGQQCIAVCPLNAIREKRKGIAVLVGGKEGSSPKLGKIIAEFLSEEEAFLVAKKCLALLKKKNSSVCLIIKEIGIKKFKQIVLREN